MRSFLSPGPYVKGGDQVFFNHADLIIRKMLPQHTEYFFAGHLGTSDDH